MPSWSLKNGGGSSADWFLNQLAVARLVLPDAQLDTIIGEEFGGTITSEVADQVGTASADDAVITGGVVTLSVGDAIVATSSARLQLTGSTTHVRDLSLVPWFLAALVKVTQPLDVTQLGQTRADAVALWADVGNYVALGIQGAASGGSTVQWVGSVDVGGSLFTVLGPNLDPAEAPVWHLFQSWPKAGRVHFAIDGQEFLTSIDAANLPALPGLLSPTVARFATGDPALVNYDKIAVFVASPTVGDP